MKKLERMLMTYWYSYENEMIDFGMMNFFTGKTAAGKSTIIDALQLMLLGGTNGTFFNKAANSKANRTLRSYLYREHGDDGAAGYNYLRKGPFTAYVALEFSDTEKDNRFTLCFVADCFADLQFEYKWVILTHNGIPEDHFINVKTKIPYTISDLKSRLNSEIGRKNFVVCDTNRQYKEQLCARFGNINGKYFTLLKKAVPFTPIADIEKFITESICDVHSEIEITDMQSDILIYKRLEDDARRTREKIDALENINADSVSFDKAKDTLLTQEYIVDRADEEETLAKEKKLKVEEEKERRHLQEEKTTIEGLTKQIDGLTAEIEKSEEEYHSSDLVHTQQNLEQKIAEAARKIKSCQDALTLAFSRIRTYGRNWKKQLDSLNQTEYVLREGFDPASQKTVDAMAEITEKNLESFDFKASAVTLNQLQTSILEEAGNLNSRLGTLREETALLQTEIHNLEKGIKPYPEYVLRFQKLLRGVTDVRILADLLEIRDPSWQNALEGYLDRQKFYFLVPEKDYLKALHIYDEAKKELNICDAGLVDIGKLRKEQNRPYLPGSLAEEIETDDPDARLYVNYLLGNVMKCESVDELNKSRTGITRSAMLYKGYVSRRINPLRYQNPFIGRRSMEQLLAMKKASLQEKEIEERRLADEHRLFSGAAREKVLSDYEAEEHLHSVQMIPRMHVEEDNKRELQKKLDGLDLTWLNKLKEKINDMKHQNMDLQNKKSELRDDYVRTEIARKRICDEELPAIERELAQKREDITLKYPDEWVTGVGEPRFQKENSSGNRSHLSLRDSFDRQITRTKTEMEQIRNRLIQKRSDYNGIYKMGYDVNAVDNSEYDSELKTLRDIRLPDYLGKIRDSGEKAYSQFRDDFIAKLKSNIETVRQQIDELNASVKNYSFGSDQYHFTIAPRAEYRRYYDMIMDPMLMDTGDWNIASQSFNDKYSKEIDELFRMLIWDESETNSERREEYEKNIRKFTDYKTYVMFDLVVKGGDGTEQRLSRTLGSKSGGETQIPFYIALLASFSQVCRVRSSKRNNTIRVIILDEAFSKMDGERIRESVRMLKKFGLQAIFSAPPDKIPDIAPYVDHNIVVYNDGERSFTRYFDPAELEESDLAEQE